MRRKRKPGPFQLALIREVRGHSIIRTHGDPPEYSLDSGEALTDHALVDECIKYGWLTGNRDGLLDGWSQTYRLSDEAVSYLASKT